MVALARLMVIGFVVLTVIYVSLSLYSRSVRRSKLKTWWEEEGRPGDLESYVEKGLADYDGSLRRKLILEIAGLRPPAPPRVIPAQMGLGDLGPRPPRIDCTIGEKLRAKWMLEGGWDY